MFKKLILACVLLITAFTAGAQNFPEKPTTLVNDYTNTLSADDKARLESKAVALGDSTSIQVAVVMIKTLDGYDPNEYAALLGRKWGVGQKDKNNGVVILVALQDRKMSIQTGYGAEGMLPDAITQQIIQNDMKPRFKQGDYAGGIAAALDDIASYNKGEYKNANHSRKQKEGDGSPVGFIIIIVVIILIIIFRNRGGGGRIIGSRGGASPFWWFIAGNMLGNMGRRDDGWSGGSGWGGGSSGGGGGFGGFGGGSFGGGGSSGSW